jgi:hypothetical protein
MQSAISQSSTRISRLVPKEKPTHWAGFFYTIRRGLQALASAGLAAAEARLTTGTTAEAIAAEAGLAAKSRLAT